MRWKPVHTLALISAFLAVVIVLVISKSSQTALLLDDAFKSEKFLDKSWTSFETLGESVINLRLDDFSFVKLSTAVASDPQSLTAQLGALKQKKEENITANGSLSVVAPHRDNIPELYDADLLILKPADQYPTWQGFSDPETLECKGIIFTTSDEIAGLSEGILSRFNHRQYAEHHGYCVLHMICTQKYIANEDTRNSSYNRLNYANEAKKAFEKAFGRDKLGFSHDKKESSMDGCSVRLSPYYYKLIGIIKLFKEWAKVRPNAVINYIYMDQDVMFTNFDIKPPTMVSAHFSLATDFLASRRGPQVPEFSDSMRLIFNTGVLFGTIGPHDKTVEILTETLLLLFTNRTEYTQAISKYWDTEQGVLTYVLLKHFPIDPDKIRDLLETFSANSNPSPYFPLYTVNSSDSYWSLVVLSQRSVAGVLRIHSPEDQNSNLTWHPGDWMVHLAPGLPHLKLPYWKTVCENFTSNPVLHRPCQWSILEK